MRHSVSAAKDWPVISQDRPVRSPDRTYAESTYLPVLIKAWQIIERHSGHQWHATSYWRKSPSHERGIALDLAPEIAQAAQSKYAYFRNSDPVLYKREQLIRKLQRAVPELKKVLPYGLGIFIEPDHLHLQLMPPEDSVFIGKWKIPKPLYPDTQARMKLPLMR